MMGLGFATALALRTDRRQAITVSIESSVQNGALAIVIASAILKNETMVLPGAIYGVLMYVTGIAFVFVARRLLR